MFKDLLKRPEYGFLAGLGAAILAPIMLPIVARAVRPLAKAALHGYFDLVDELKSLAADDEKYPTPVLGAVLTAGAEEAATAAGEVAVEEEAADTVAEGAATILELV